MKKIFLIAVIALFSLSACVPGFLGGDTEEAPAAAPVDVNATVDAASSTQAVETFAALATPTLEPATPTDEPTATATETLVPTEEEATATLTETPDEAAADEETATPTETTTPEATGTPTVTATSVYPSPTSPISINLPPPDEVPYYRVDVSNNTKGPVYISLQGSTEGGYKPVIEYDIPRWTKIKLKVPKGFYTIIVYVGADPMIDYVGIYSKNGISIIIEPDKLKINK